MRSSWSIVWLLALGTSCAGDVQSLDDVMGELVDDVPQTLLIPAEHTQVCLANFSCMESVHEHRLDLNLRSRPPARRRVMGDSIDIAGSFRLIRREAEHEEVLSEGALSEGRLTRQSGPAGAISVSLTFDVGSVFLQAPDGEHWDAPSLNVRR